MTSWSFMTSGQIRFGAGTGDGLTKAAQNLGLRPLLVTGRSGARHAAILTDLHAAFSSVTCFAVASEPTLHLIQQGVRTARKAGADVVIGLGGGSVMDAAKAIAALAPNPRDPLDYLEVVGKGLPLDVAPLPVIAVPTTAGTGAEVTKNAVIGVPEHGRKVSLRDNRMLPRLAIVDPDLTQGSPIPLIAATGLDALTQCIEPYLSCRANPLSDALCREGITRAAGALPKLLKGGIGATLRHDMSLASLMGGLALANAGLGAVHGCAGVLGGRADAAHGALCGRLLPATLRINFDAVTEHGDTGLESRFRDVARWLTGRPDIAAMCDHLEELLTAGQVSRLGAYRIDRDTLPEIAQSALGSSSMKANPVPLNAGEVLAILEASW